MGSSIGRQWAEPLTVNGQSPLAIDNLPGRHPRRPGVQCLSVDSTRAERPYRSLILFGQARWMERYTSTDCRAGDHQTCRERRIVPYCACLCHAANDEGSADDD